MTEAAALPSLPDLFAQAEHLPTLPTVAVEILRLSRDETASLEDLTAVLALDPALSAKILKLANSAAFRRGAEVTSLERATLLLGMHAIQLLALSFSLTKSLPRRGPSYEFDYSRYWQHSVTMAVGARELARLTQSPHQHEAFLCGLLSGIGQLVLAQVAPESYNAVLNQSPDGQPTADLERRELGFDHHEVGEALLHAWMFPQVLSDTIRYWRMPDTLPPEVDETTQTLCRLLYLADLTRRIIWEPDPDQALRTLYDQGQSFFGVAEIELDTAFIGLESSLVDSAALLDVEMVRPEDFSTLLSNARDQMVQVSLGAVLDLQHTTAHAQELEQEKQHLSALAQTDALTGLLNRSGLELTLEHLIDARIQGGSKRALGLLMIDIDYFKAFNDTYGHLLGDQVLKQVATWIAAAIRNADVAARYGGEEFVVVVPDTTLDSLERVAERIRTRVEAGQVRHEGQPLSVTISVGGACVHQVQSLKDGMALLKLADGCLYEAKDAGRNRSICCEVSDGAV